MIFEILHISFSFHKIQFSVSALWGWNCAYYILMRHIRILGTINAVVSLKIKESNVNHKIQCPSASLKNRVNPCTRRVCVICIHFRINSSYLINLPSRFFVSPINVWETLRNRNSGAGHFPNNEDR